MKKLLAIVLTLSLLAACIVPAAAETTEAQVKTDISTATISVGAQPFIGMPVEPTIHVYLNGNALTGGEDYVYTCENNVNMGTATVYVIGIGNYYGSVSRDFQINNVQQAIELNGAYMGQADGELAEQTYYSEHIVTPGAFEARINSTVGHYTRKHQAYYELYRMVGEEDMTLVTSYESDYGYSDDTKFTYDFSSVYEGATEEGGEIYVLISVWINSQNEVYSNSAFLGVPAKVPDGTEMVVEEVEGTATFRNTYLSAYSPDGNLGKPTWTSSDPTVATVENGVVTKLTPGTVTITGQWNGLSASYSLTVEKQNLANGTILSYNPTGETAKIYYQGQLLEAGKDYALTATQSGDNATVTVTGCGLFAGQLVRTFNAAGEPVDHTHGYDHACDTTCNFCDATRVTQHAFGTEWEKDLNNHWYECAVCGEKKDQDGHTISPEDPNLCTVCGKIGIPGDIDGNRQVNSDDVVQLLLHISMPDLFPITVNADFTGDSKVTSDDVVQLLLHISMPDLFPLQ